MGVIGQRASRKRLTFRIPATTQTTGDFSDYNEGEVVEILEGKGPAGHKLTSRDDDEDDDEEDEIEGAPTVN